MRRRRRAKYTWFPIIGSAGPAETDDNWSTLNGLFRVEANGTTFVAINPIVPDVPLEGDDIDTSAGGQLVQAIGQEYIVKRIVGKAHLGVSGPLDDPPTTIFPKTVLIGMGIFVARANDRQVGGGQNTPIGSATAAERIENYSPLSEDVIREPWMWRRTWVLSTGRGQGGAAAAGPQFGIVANGADVSFVQHIQAGAPKTNAGYGSALDGPHFDIKSARRVRTDERLWLAIATRSLDQEFSGAVPTQALDGGPGGGVALVFDFRVLGALRKAKNRSNF